VPLLVTPAIVLHGFDYLESSRIVRLVTRDAGMRSALAKGARKSRRRFGSGLDLFGQGTAFLHTRPGRDLDTLSGFEDVRARSELGLDLDRFTGAEAIAEIALSLGRDGGEADAPLFDTIAGALDGLLDKSGDDARDATIAGAWRIVAAVGVAPSVEECAECASPIEAGEAALFTHTAGGVLCRRCASLSAGGRKLPGDARGALAAWLGGRAVVPLEDAAARAHQRLLREFIAHHVHDGGSRSLRAFDMWARGSRPAAAVRPLSEQFG
jgi:DNA repair protein RecO (recombination protein O)